MTSSRPRRRVFIWIFLAMQALFLIWIITGVHAATHTPCGNLDYNQCQSAKEAGGGIAVIAQLFVWAVADLVVGGTYGLYRLTRRGNK